jgi:hypothetical protein
MEKSSSESYSGRSEVRCVEDVDGRDRFVSERGNSAVAELCVDLKLEVLRCCMESLSDTTVLDSIGLGCGSP